MRTSFKIPLQSEVEKYIKEKMSWPESFVKHYADKFWNHYQASGWKLSSGNSIKDWKACFNSQWKIPKFKEDIELLYGKQATGPKMEYKEVKAMTPTNEIEALDQLLNAYAQHPTTVPFDQFGKWYDYLKGKKLLRPFTAVEVDQLRKVYNGDNGKCRCAVVQMTFDGYVNSGFTFKKVFEVREKLTVK